MLRSTATGVSLALMTMLASAQTTDTDNPGGLRPFIGVGYTFGGDTIQHVTLQPKGTTIEYQEDISAGGGLDLRVGLDYRFRGSPFSLQASLAYHNDQVNGSDGERSFFVRVPVELVALYHFNPRGSVGLGVRKATHAKFSSRGGTCTYPDGSTEACPRIDEKLNASTGIILEAEWAVTPSWGLKGRYVRESFKFENDPTQEKYEGDHVGLMSVFYFN